VSVLPSIQQLTVSPPNWKLKALPFVPGGAVVIDPSVTDSGSVPPWRIRPGNVLVKRTATKTYVSASDPTGDRSAPASVLALVPADATWQGATIMVTVESGVPISTVLAATDNTNALVVTRLNSNPSFAGLLVADVAGNVVRIRTLRGGREVSILVTSTLAAAFGAAGMSALGSDADYRVLEDFTDLQDNTGMAVPGIGATSLAGYYAAQNLLNLTPEAQVVLSRNGALFG